MRSERPAGSTWVCVVGVLVIALGGTVPFHASAASSRIFAPALSTPIRATGVSVTAGDFNGDGKLDLAVATAAGEVSIFLGRGDGTFQAPINSAANADPGPMVAGDFNGDGKLDLVVANRSGGISVLLGNGNGTFQPPVNEAPGYFPLGLTAGDWNGDGKLDLVVANGQEGIVVLLGKGDGTFRTGTSYLTNGTAESVAAGDLNGDGKVDLAVADGASGVTILLGNGDGTFHAAEESETNRDPRSVALGDLNGDGKLDVVSTATDGNVYVWLGNGDGTLQAPVSYPAGDNPQSVVVADFNTDGKLDALVTTTAGISVLLGNGNGTLQAPLAYGAGEATGPIAVGDFHATGALSAAVLSPSTISVLLNQSSPFNHTGTGFPLTGFHATLPCAQCHVNNNFTTVPTACIGCHHADFNNTNNPPHVAAGFPTNCSLCHTTANWTGAVFNHPTSPLALTGAHLTLTCAQCHVNNNFNLTSAACFGCHQPDYNSALNPPHRTAGFPTDCSLCHTTAPGWGGAVFNHTGTGFSLTGAHVTLSCAQCHVNNNYSLTSANTTCISCHQADFNGANNPPHLAAGFPTDCTVCHGISPLLWTTATFNHSGPPATFPLVGAHTSLQCAQCHVNNNYSLTSANTTCISCHQADFNGANNPPHVAAGFPTDCSLCHTTAPGWGGAVFNHPTSPLALTGAHLTLTCAQCHVNGNFTYTPADCFSCHQINYNNTTNPNHRAAGYSTNCAACHSTASW